MSPSEGSCRKGHDLSLLGRDKNAKCVACLRAAASRYATTEKGRARTARYRDAGRKAASDAHYVATNTGQISKIRAQLRWRINKKITRVAELERELQYAST